MDYKEALKLKVEWEMETKPYLKSEVEMTREDLDKRKEHAIEMDAFYSENKKEMIEIGADVVLWDEDTEMTPEEYIKVVDMIVKSKEDMVKFKKYELCVLSYVYNGDIENATTSYHKFRDISYELIECLELTTQYVDLCRADDKVGVKTHKKEDAYLEMCNDIKISIQAQENLIKHLSLIKGEVKEVLKAHKKMNKRKNKNNNKK